MIITNDVKLNSLNLIRDYRKNQKVSAIPFTSFLEVLLANRKEKFNRKYPYTVRIPKSIKELLKGDYEPAREIVVESPIYWHDKEIWTGKTTSRIEIHPGYENGDKRFLSEMALDKKSKPHLLMGGATGQGKSVTGNDIIYSMLFLYAPWELELILADSKIAEFKRYGVMHSIPHISTIAATGDSNYIISILDKFVDDMQRFNAVLGAAGVQNIKDFEEKTGLTVASKVLYLEEYQAMFKNADKKAGKIQKDIDDLARLGRNTGYHLIMTSQEVDSNVKPMLPNIANRICLACTSTVSDIVLGNNQAASGILSMGRCLINSEAIDHGGDKSYNKKFVAPLQSAEEFKELGIFLDKLGDRFNFRYKKKFYDEEKPLTETDFTKLISERKGNDSVMIGVPSFINDDPDKYELDYTDEDIENTMVFCASNQDLKRYVRTFYLNALEDLKRGSASHAYLIADPILLGDIDLRSHKIVSFRIKDTTNAIWQTYQSYIYYKTLLVEVDELAFTNGETSSEAKEVANKIFSGSPNLVTEINISRIHYMMKKLYETRYIDAFSMNRFTESQIAKEVPTIIANVFEVVKGLGSQYFSTRITKKDLPRFNIHVVGAQKISRLGRDVKNPDPIKRMLMDSYEANTRFIFYTSNVDEMIGIRAGFTRFIMNGVNTASGKVRCEDYPKDERPACGIYFEYPSKVVSFKKLKLEDDLY